MNSDTTITLYWRDGSKKIESVYKLKRIKEKSGEKITVLKKLKDVKYFKPDCVEEQDEDWPESGKCEISRKDFDNSYSLYNKMDSLKEVMRKAPKKSKKNSITLYLGNGNLRPIPLNLDLGSPGIHSYVKRDTLILGNTYTYQIFMKDTLSNSSNTLPGSRFCAALRIEAYKIYCFNSITQNEELKVDMEAITKEMGEKIINTAAVFIKIIFTTTNAFLNTTKSGATKGLGFILSNLILLQK